MLNFPLTFRPLQPMAATDARLTPSAPNNPFRNRPASPNPPPRPSNDSDSDSDSDGPEEPTAQARSGQTRSPQSTSESHNGTPTITVDTAAPPAPSDPLTEELPPAYTPAPDVYSGEQSVEFGPRRPFQRAPPPLMRSQQPPGQWQSPQSTGWSAYPGQMHSHSTGSSYTSTRPGLVPPPSHPRSAPRDVRDIRPTSMPDMPMPNVTSEFARDFYNAGSGPADVSALGEQDVGQNGEGARTPPAETRPQYAPPPDLPPRPSGSNGHSRSRSDAGTRSSPTSSTSNGVPDDGSPTKQPTPGHPLLNHGNILVYPKGHECKKCESRILRSACQAADRSYAGHNTGYKHYDPLRPCKKCWSKFGKEYSGAITYTPWSSSGTTTSSSGNVMQKPLPKISTSHPPARSYLTRPATLRDSSTSRPSSGYPGASNGRVIPIGGGGVPMSPYLDSTQQRAAYPPPQSPPGPIITSYNPPPGATVYPPGHPGLGGRLCWRCCGSGTVSLFFIDESTCGICNGVGRTYL